MVRHEVLEIGTFTETATWLTIFALPHLRCAGCVPLFSAFHCSCASETAWAICVP